MKKMIIAYRVLVALGLFLFLIGLVNLALDYQLGSFQLLSVLLATGGIVCTGFASIMVDDCKIRAKTEVLVNPKHPLVNRRRPQTNEEIDEEVTAFLQDSPNLSPESKEVWRGAITEGARAERDERLAKDLQYLARLIRKGEKGFNK